MSAYLDAQTGDSYYTQPVADLYPDGNYGAATSYNPNAGSFMDLLKFGVGHYASLEAAKINRPTAAQPVYTNAGQTTVAQAAVNQTLIKWALIGGGVFLAITLLSKPQG